MVFCGQTMENDMSELNVAALFPNDNHECERCKFTYSFPVMTFTADGKWYCDECLKTLIEQGEIAEIIIGKKK